VLLDQYFINIKNQLFEMKNFYFRNRFSMFGALLKKILTEKKDIFSKICMY